MRASPAFQVSLREFGTWRVAVVTLFLGGALTLLAWVGLRQPPFEPVFSVGVTIAFVLLAWAVRGLLRTPPVTMRWDGERWFIARTGHDPASGELSPALDLGAWMLLRFVPIPPGAVVWIPAQRRGIESQWHALRCAVYSPHAAPTDTRPAEP